jgi:hypothetical protein
LTPRLTGAAWVRPTVRLIPWWGLALPAGGAALVGFLVRLASSDVPDQVGIAAVAATAAAAPQLLEDPAHRLLSAVPLSRRRRVSHRLALFLPALLVSWVLVAPLVVDSGDSAAISIGPLLALAAIGLAGGCLAARVRPELAAPVGTAIPLGLVAIQLALEDQVAQADILGVWTDHPWATAAAAGLVGLVSLHERAAGGFGQHTAVPYVIHSEEGGDRQLVDPTGVSQVPGPRPKCQPATAVTCPPWTGTAQRSFRRP